MPPRIKAMLSALVVIVALAAFWWESESTGGPPAWIILALAAFMIFSMWIFPEGKKPPAEKQD